MINAALPGWWTVIAPKISRAHTGSVFNDHLLLGAVLAGFGDGRVGLPHVKESLLHEVLGGLPLPHHSTGERARHSGMAILDCRRVGCLRCLLNRFGPHLPEAGTVACLTRCSELVHTLYS